MGNLLFFDGFDEGIGNARADAHAGGSGSTSNNLFASTAFRRFPLGLGVARVSDQNTSYQDYKLAAAVTRIVAGIAVRPTSGGLSAGQGYSILFLRNASNSVQLKVRYNADYAVEVTDNWGTVLAVTDTGALQADVWSYVEIDITCHSSTGSIRIRVDGGDSADVTETNKNTNPEGGGTYAVIGIGAPNSTDEGSAPTTYRWHLDDLYVHEDTLLGDVRVVPLLPDGDGAHTDWSPSGANRWEMVDDPGDGNDGDSTYILGETVTDKNSVTLENLPGPVEVFAVAVTTESRKVEAGDSREVTPFIRLAGTDTALDPFAVPASYGVNWQMREEKPGGGAFAYTHVNGLEIGVELTG